MHGVTPPRPRSGRGALIFFASLCATWAIASTAIAQTMVDTPELAMTGWRIEAATIDTATLGMTGWRIEAETIDTATLGMTGWRTGPVVIDTAALAMTGWRTGPVVIDTAALAMTGWRGGPNGSRPFRASPAVVRDSDTQVCPAGMQLRGRSCVGSPGIRPKPENRASGRRKIEKR
jgi:hypothetical protein